MNSYDFRSKMKYADLTEVILQCAFDVINELGAGFLESVYQNALSLALMQAGLYVNMHYPINVIFRKESVGEFYADILVEKKIIVELKAVKELAPEHQAQVINYLKATGIEVGLLINFGNQKLQYKRLIRNLDFENKF